MSSYVHKDIKSKIYCWSDTERTSSVVLVTWRKWTLKIKSVAKQ